MGNDNEYIAIRMIVLNPNYPENTREHFEAWMKKDNGFLHKMWESFHNRPELDAGPLQDILLLRGHKEDDILGVADLPHMSASPAENRAGSTSAGANADFAWITRWSNRAANQEAWKNGGRCDGWDEAWEEFLGRCYPRDIIPGTLGAAFDTPDRPLHGPPFDYLGAPGLFPSRGKPTPHYGRGAGCLVEGFEVVDHWPR